MPDISIVVPTYNAQNTICACLESVITQKTCLSYEVIVVDSSTDSTADVLRDAFPSVSFLKSRIRLDPGSARNRGFAAAVSEKVFFLDSDCVVASDWLTRLSSALDDGADGVCGALEPGQNTSILEFAHHLLEFHRFLPGKGEGRKVKSFVAANCGFKRKALKGHTFVERNGGEDLMFTLGLSREGRELMFLPSISTRHIVCLTTTEVFRRQFRMGRDAAWLRKETKSPGDVFFRVPPLLIFFPALSCFFVVMCLARARGRLLTLGILLLPVCIVLNLIWSAGFIQEVLEGMRVQ